MFCASWDLSLWIEFFCGFFFLLALRSVYIDSLFPLPLGKCQSWRDVNYEKNKSERKNEE